MYLLCCGTATSASLLSPGTTTGIKWEWVCHTSFTRLWWIWWSRCLGWWTFLLYKWHRSTWWVWWHQRGGAKAAVMYGGGSRAEQESQMWKGKAVESLQAAAAAWPHVWVFPCGNKLQLPKVWFNICAGEPWALAVHLVGASHYYPNSWITSLLPGRKHRP